MLLVKLLRRSSVPCGNQPPNTSAQSGARCASIRLSNLLVAATLPTLTIAHYVHRYFTGSDCTFKLGAWCLACSAVMQICSTSARLLHHPFMSQGYLERAVAQVLGTTYPLLLQRKTNTSAISACCFATSVRPILMSSNPSCLSLNLIGREGDISSSNLLAYSATSRCCLCCP